MTYKNKILNGSPLGAIVQSTDGFLRAYPIIVIISCIVFYFIKPSMDTFKIVCAISISQMSVQVLKYFAKLIMKDKTFPFIGKGTRPKGAKGCGLFKNNELSRSYGMPSGHSMLAVSFATSMTLYINDSNELTDTQKQMSQILLWTTTVAVISSRVMFGCHTPGQVIVGSCIGASISYIIHNFLKF